jgi:antitoxin CcdA
VGYSRLASKRPTNITLDEDLVRRARLLTPNLSSTVESLLREFVTREQGRRAAADAAVAEVIDGFNAYHAQHGLLSDEFSAL